jgi:hypothetical protein
MEAALPGAGTVVTPTALLWSPSARLVHMADEWDIALPSPDEQLDALVGHNVVTAMAMFTRDDYDRFGPYRDESFVEDWDLWIRMALGGVRFVRPALPTLLYRWGHANVSSKRPLVSAAEAVLIERHRAALTAALGAERYSAALARRVSRLAWVEAFELLKAGDGRAAKRLARRHLRSGDRRLLATAVLPTTLILRRLRLGAASTP